MSRENHSLLYSFAQERYNSQIQRNNELDEKNGKFLSFISAILGVIVVLLAEGLFTNNISNNCAALFLIVLIALMMIFLGLAIRQLLSGLRLRTFSAPKLDRKLLNDINEDSIEQNYIDFSTLIYECIQENESLLNDKASCFKGATQWLKWALFVFGLIALFILVNSAIKFL